MRNPEYWQRQYLVIKDEDDTEEIPPLSYSYHSLACFQKGITCFVIGEKRRGMRFIIRGTKLIMEEIDENPTSSNLMWVFIGKWFLNNFPDKELLQKIVDVTKEEFSQNILNVLNKDIYTVWQKTPFAEKIDLYYFDREDEKDIYPYQRAAYFFLQMAIRFFMATKYQESLTFAQGCLEICNYAYKKIHLFMANYDPQWTPLMDTPSLAKTLPEGVEETYEEHKRKILGDLPIYKMGAKIIEEVCNALLDPRDDISRAIKVMIGTKAAIDKVSKPKKFQLYRRLEPLETYEESLKKILLSSIGDTKLKKKIKKRLNTFFNTVINPLGKEFSILPLLEEMEWVIIRRNIETLMDSSVEFLSLPDLVRVYLG